MTTETIVACARCKALRSTDELSECFACDWLTCGQDGCSGRCACYEMNLSLHPVTARRYYDLLDRMNAACRPNAATVDELQFAAWEDELDTLEHQLQHGGFDIP